MASPELTIPESQRNAFIVIAKAGTERLDAILKSLGELRPSVFLRTSAETLADRSGLSEDEARIILIMLSSLFFLREQDALTPEDLREQVLAAAESDEKIPFAQENRDRLSRFLQEALALEGTLGVTSKAWSVIRDAERTYCYSRVLTDIRPVFRPDNDQAEIFSIIHNLKIAYHKGDELLEFFVELHPREIKLLAEVLRRAELKEKNLRSALRSSTLALLEDH